VAKTGLYPKIRQLTDSEEMDFLADWSPDGANIAFIRMDWINLDRINLDIYITTSDGEEKQLTDQLGDETLPTWSPDGNIISYIHLDIPFLGCSEIWAVDLLGNNYELTADFDRPSFEPLFSSSGLYFRAINQGTADIYEIRDKEVKRITRGEREILGSEQITMDVVGDMIAYTSSELNQPREVFVYDLGSETKKQVTHLNDDFLKEVKLLETVEFWFNASDGTPIQGWYLKPEQEKEKCPLIINAHGGPHISWNNLLNFYSGFDFQVLASQGYVVAYINERGSLGYGREFAEATRGA